MAVSWRILFLKNVRFLKRFFRTLRFFSVYLTYTKMKSNACPIFNFNKENFFMMTVTTTITMNKKNIEKFIKLYGEGDGEFSLSLVVPEPKKLAKKNEASWHTENWGTKTDAMDYGNGIDLREVLSGDSNFQTADKPPVEVFKKMAADGLEFEIYWEAEDIADWGIGKGKAKEGKFWYCIDFAETADRYLDETGDEWDPRDCAFVNHVDEYGNVCEIDTSRVLVYTTGLNIHIWPVKKMLENDLLSFDDEITAFKIPSYFEGVYEREDLENEFGKFSDNLYSYDENGFRISFLDKNGKQTKSLADFDHSNPDEDGYVYYSVPDSDLENGLLTDAAVEKWSKRLGLKKKKQVKKAAVGAPQKVVAKNKEDLQKIVKAAIKKYGANCDLNFIDVSKVTDMSDLFNDRGILSKFNGDISKWNVSKVEDMSSMFFQSQFNGDISQWDVSNVTSMFAMFNGSCFNGDISQWDVSNVTIMWGMFARSQFNGDISKWDVSKVQDMTYTFSSSQFNGDISQWNVSNVSLMVEMFAKSQFTGDISKWNVSNVKKMRGMFKSSKFQGNLNKWKVSKDVNMTDMFADSPLASNPPKWYKE